MAGVTPEIDASVPHSARILNYWLGGQDNYAVDRRTGKRMLAMAPDMARSARENRYFLGRAVRYLAGEAGIRQFLDIGTGLPTANNTHEVAQRVAPESRIVYVDNDPLVLVHARALLTSTPEGACDYIDADVNDPETILREAARTLDFSQPVAIMMLAILQFVPGGQAQPIIGRLIDAVPSGSYLTIAHPTAEVDGEAMNKVMQFWNKHGSALMTLRTRAEIVRLFDRVKLLDPGVVSCPRWRPEPATTGETADVTVFCGIGRKL
jgi:O-methyltransferase involved in polyketide biosynthesis